MKIPFVEALEHMQRYAKFLKDLFTNKRVQSIDFNNHVHHYDPFVLDIWYRIRRIQVNSAYRAPSDQSNLQRPCVTLGPI